VCNNIPRDIPKRDPPRTYIHMYFVRIDPEPGANALSLSAIITFPVVTGTVIVFQEGFIGTFSMNVTKTGVIVLPVPNN